MRWRKRQIKYLRAYWSLRVCDTASEMSWKFSSTHPGIYWNILEFYFFITVRTLIYVKGVWLLNNALRDLAESILTPQEYRFYPVMPDRASRDSTRAFSGGFSIRLRKRSSVRYYRRSHRQLQRVQNYAAWLVVRCSRRDHITPVLKKLHWLPVKQRVTYKIILLTFRALNGLAPIYIADMLHHHRPTRALRSADNNDLQVPSTSSRYGDRAFAASAPRLWNALPRELKIATSLTSFKRLLKTHLFRIAYELDRCNVEQLMAQKRISI